MERGVSLSSNPGVVSKLSLQSWGCSCLCCISWVSGLCFSLDLYQGNSGYEQQNVSPVSHTNSNWPLIVKLCFSFLYILTRENFCIVNYAFNDVNESRKKQEAPCSCLINTSKSSFCICITSLPYAWAEWSKISCVSVTLY